MKYWTGDLPRGWAKFIPEHNFFRREHGARKHHKSPSYISWFCMIQRCYGRSKTYDPRNVKYRENNIQVCMRWVVGDGNKHGFLCFLEDMGERLPDTTIDRIDTTNNYHPNNCRWADASTQAHNKRRKVGK